MNGLAALGEIAKIRENISKVEYPMSIGEMKCLYERKEFSFTPKHTWSGRQKELFIKSILWGMPLPSIIIKVREDGGWELLDGAERFNAIFDFMGVYKEMHGEVPMPLHMENGGVMLYDDLPEIDRINFIRARMDVKIIIAKTPEAELEVQLFLSEMR